MPATGKISHNLAIFKDNFFTAWSEVFSWSFSRLYAIVAVVLNLLAWLGTVLIFRSLGDELTVLHYNIDFGIDLVGHRGQLFFNPTLGLVLILLNLILILLLARHKDFKFIAYLLWAAAVLVNVFLLLAVLAVYLINFR